MQFTTEKVTARKENFIKTSINRCDAKEMPKLQVVPILRYESTNVSKLKSNKLTKEIRLTLISQEES